MPWWSRRLTEIRYIAAIPSRATFVSIEVQHIDRRDRTPPSIAVAGQRVRLMHDSSTFVFKIIPSRLLFGIFSHQHTYRSQEHFDQGFSSGDSTDQPPRGTRSRGRSSSGSAGLSAVRIVRHWWRCCPWGHRVCYGIVIVEDRETGERAFAR